jgi:serine protease Do
VLVTQVQPGGKGDQAGIQSGDVIKEINRKPVTTPKEVKTQIDEVKSGDSFQMLIKRAHAGLIALKIQA